MTAPQRCWRFTVDLLPPGNNHQYRLTEQQGGKALTDDAKARRQVIATTAGATGFRPRPDACYAVWVRFTMPGWGGDIDGPVKALLDAVFGREGDRRIVELRVLKRVQPGVKRTEMTITDITELAAGDG